MTFTTTHTEGQINCNTIQIIVPAIVLIEITKIIDQIKDLEKMNRSRPRRTKSVNSFRLRGPSKFELFNGSDEFRIGVFRRQDAPREINATRYHRLLGQEKSGNEKTRFLDPV